jgi:hypothetical protein
MSRYVFLFLIVLGIFISPDVLFARLSDDPFVEQWAFADTGVYNAWDSTVGSQDVVVAIIDNGFDMFHPDLRENAWKNVDEIPHNNIDDDNNGYVDDVWGWNFVPEDMNNDGYVDDRESMGNAQPRPDPSSLTAEEIKDGTIHHGTIVAGIIGARGNNGKDGAGINWHVRLMNLKILGNAGHGTFDPMEKAIYYAVDNGADVINISVVGIDVSGSITKAVAYAHNKGVVVVAAAGNDMTDLDTSYLFPVCSDAADNITKVLGVSAMTEEHYLAKFSNTGTSCIDITAPGENISSTVRFSPTNGLTERYRSGWKGTSFAAPMVSGAAALIKSIQPLWGPKEIFHAILSTVHHTPNDDEAGYANIFGKGLLQIDKAVAYAFSQITSLRRIDMVVSVDKEGREIIAQHKKATTADNHHEFRDIDRMATFVMDGQAYTATLKQEGRQATVAIYSWQWKQIHAWSVPTRGVLGIDVGDVTGDSALEVVLSHEYVDDQIFRVYDLNGEFLYEHILDGKHTGAAVTLGYAQMNVRPEIVSVYQTGDGVTHLATYADSGEQKQRMTITAFGAPQSIVAFDADQDGVDEYAITTTKSQGSRIGYFSANGSVRRLFTPYGSSYRGVVMLQSGDYDADGKDDVLTVPIDGSERVRVWSGQARKISEWWPFGKDDTRPFSLFVRYL